MKIIRSLRYMALCLLLFWMAGTDIRAAEEKDAVLGILQTLSVDVEVKQEAEAGAAMVGNLSAGTTVVVTGEEGAWSKILCQEMEGYILSDALGPFIEEAGQLDVEIGDVEEANLRTAEESERYYRNKRASLLWRIAGTVSVLAIFGVGVIFSFRNARKEKRQRKEFAGSSKGKEAGREIKS